MSRTFVIGDIHGAYRALRQCLDRSGFVDQDRLICLGDVSDGWPETKRCIDQLLQIRDLTYILGNHDLWTYQWMLSGKAENIWLSQGGEATLKSYSEGVPQSHVDFLKKALPYYIDDSRLFVHAGINPDEPLEMQSVDTFLWDRSLVHKALELYSRKVNTKLTSFDEVYVGHTPILLKAPIQSGGVWLMDTGAGWTGVLSMMNVDTKESFVSDPVPDLYPGVEGRKGK